MMGQKYDGNGKQCLENPKIRPIVAIFWVFIFEKALEDLLVYLVQMDHCGNMLESSLKTTILRFYLSHPTVILRTFFMLEVAFEAGDNSPRTLQSGGIMIF